MFLIPMGASKRVRVRAECVPAESHCAVTISEAGGAPAAQRRARSKQLAAAQLRLGVCFWGDFYGGKADE